MDRDSQVLAQGLRLGMPRTYTAPAEQGDVESLFVFCLSSLCLFTV